MNNDMNRTMINNKTMTGAEKVLEWMKKYYEVNGTPNYGEIIAQLEMAIEEEKRENKFDIYIKK